MHLNTTTPNHVSDPYDTLPEVGSALESIVLTEIRDLEQLTLGCAQGCQGKLFGSPCIMQQIFFQCYPRLRS